MTMIKSLAVAYVVFVNASVAETVLDVLSTIANRLSHHFTFVCSICSSKVAPASHSMAGTGLMSR